jgi:hypothetical protein
MEPPRGTLAANERVRPWRPAQVLSREALGRRIEEAQAAMSAAGGQESVMRAVDAGEIESVKEVRDAAAAAAAAAAVQLQLCGGRSVGNSESVKLGGA